MLKEIYEYIFKYFQPMTPNNQRELLDPQKNFHKMTQALFDWLKKKEQRESLPYTPIKQ